MVVLMALTFTGLVRCSREDNYQVVSVKTHPEKGYYTLSNTRSCTADRVYNLPATRTFKSGRTDSYDITTIVGKVEVCK